MSRTKYRSVGTADNGTVLIWQATRPASPNESRVEEIRCNKSWFRNMDRVKR